MWVGSTYYSFATDTVGSSATTFAGYTPITSPAGTYNAGNYAVFSNLTGASFTVSQSDAASCGIAAVEIVPNGTTATAPAG